MNGHLGEIAALATAVCWAFGSIMFTMSGRRIGSMNVNRGRLVVAAALLSVAHLAISGQPVPLDATAARWLWLGLSGVVGFIIGDGLLFESFVLVGPRLAMLLMSLVPIMSAILAWIFLGETLRPVEVFAIAITVGGIIWVVADKRRGSADIHPRRLFLGIALGLGGALGQTVGLVLSKKGLEGGFPALSGNVIRVVTAALITWFLAALGGRAARTIASYRDKQAVLTLSAGAFFGPFVGVWLSLVAIIHAKIGVATTLMSLTPIFLIPITKVAFGEKITAGAVLGTVVAVAGVAVLLLA